MAPPPLNRQQARDEPQSVRVPAGAPEWVTPELIEHTRKIWQPFYDHQLIPDQIVEIIMGVGRMFEVLSIGDDHEAVRRTCESEQPGAGERRLLPLGAA